MGKKFVLAPDSFKESLSAIQACQAMTKGILAVFPDADVCSFPMADGGEGTVDALLQALGGKRIDLTVSGPLVKEQVRAYYGWFPKQQLAVVEMAKANGLELLASSKRNPLRTSSYGTGQLIRHALNQGAKRIILGLGGSATNDGGAGMAQALGLSFIGQDQQILPAGLSGGTLAEVSALDMTALDSRLAQTEIILACDVTNPLLGPSGASQIFGPQKGATAQMIPILEENLKHYARLLQQAVGRDVALQAGAGAAGGLGASLLALTNAQWQLGSNLIADLLDLEGAIKNADYVFTGEGRIDGQTAFGKVPLGVANLAQKYNKPVYACVGQIDQGSAKLYQAGITAIFSLVPGPISLPDALAQGAVHLETTVENICRLLASSQAPSLTFRP
ncbi:glycerate kinase [Streptococcus halichoeri]|uniref:glycerate kinase family protein n=1 Tax=Streptococcus halichoeri TaxID=254785 RepID=UPI00135B7E19|nr:glycerate kinase [Streptococcus halichoeri]